MAVWETRFILGNLITRQITTKMFDNDKLICAITSN